MQYILLIAPRAFDPGQLGSIAPDIEAVLAGPEKDFLLRGATPDQDIRLFPLGEDCSDWADDPQQVAKIEAVGPTREIYAVHFKDVERLKTVLRGLVRGGGCIVDDDHDLFVSGEKFVSLSETNPRANSWWLGGHYA